MMDKTRFVAQAGLGYWGKNILRNLAATGTLLAACDSDEATLEQKKKEYPDVHFTSGFGDLLADPGVRAIVVSTPAATHYGYVKSALLADKDVFVEKPLSLTVEEGEELVEIARERARVLMVGHILQYHPAVRKLKELISGGRLGRLEYVYSNRLNIGKLRTEENILWSFAPHDISVIRMLIGDDPSSVSAHGGDYLNRGVYDTTLTSLEFKNGVKGHIFVSWLHPFKEQKLVVVGSGGMAVFDDMSAEKLFVYPHRVEWKEGRVPVAHKAEAEVVSLEAGEPLKLEIEHFLDCVRTRKTPATDGAEGLAVLKILDSAERSLKATRNQGKAVASKTRAKEAHEGVFVHESACVDEGAQIGEGTKLWHFSHVLKGTRIGRRCVVGQNVVIGPDVTIGDGCKIQNNVSVYKGVTLEDGVFCGPSCVFTNVYNPRAFVERKHEFLETLVKKGATIGANATIVCGSTVGAYSLIGAGAVVKKDVPDYAIVAGVPARQVGWACKCGVTLKVRSNKAKCACGNSYSLTKKGLKPVVERE